MKGQNIAKSGECLSDDLLVDYLEGNLEHVVRAACELHMIGCDKCRGGLAFFMRLLKEGNGPGETAIVDTVSENWANRKVRSESAGKARTMYSFKLWFAMLAGAAALVVLTLQVVPLFTSSPLDKINALVLSQQYRPFEARLSEQPYRPYRTVRSAAGSQLNFDAAAAEALKDFGADDHGKGVLEFLQKKPEAALQSMQRALESAPSAAVHNDLGVVYLEMGGPENYANARREFDAALSLDKNYEPALFNRALLALKLLEPDAASQRYLESDPDSEWADEVRSKAGKK